MKKLLPIALATILMIGLVFLMIPNAFAEHVATVAWVESGSDTLAVSPVTWPRWLNFTVSNSGPDGIVEIKFVIQKNGEGNALFKFENSKHKYAADLWTAIPDEFGPDNYPTVVYFRKDPSGNPITEGTGEFDILFSDGPETCNYQFDLWTADDGAPSGIGHNVLKITMDGELPELTFVSPLDGQKVDAIFAPYPSKWYLWINFTAADNPDHDSNISRVVVDIVEVNDGPEWDIIYDPPYEPEVVFEKKYWDLEQGNYTLCVTIYDGAGNEYKECISFEFFVPYLVRLDPDIGTVGPLTTYDPETGLYTGTKEVYPAVGGTKVLGTEVKIVTKAGAFTGNSKVNVTVHGLPYAADALVLKNVETDSEGKFKETPSFLFPTAPHEIYIVTLKDADGVTVPLEFTVIPEIVYKPVIVIGPAPIEVIATGLPAHGHVNGLTCDGTDALMGVNLQVFVKPWYTDENGTLQTAWADKPGLLMPVLEPGTYEIGLNFMFGECHEDSISNLVAVVNCFEDLCDILDELELKLDDIKPIIERIDGNVVQIKSEVGNIEVKLDDLEPIITLIEENVVEIKTIVGSIKGTVESIEGDVVSIKGTLEDEEWDIRVKVGEIYDAQAEEWTMPLSITAVLSAIAAIAAIVAVVVVLRRLKVAA